MVPHNQAQQLTALRAAAERPIRWAYAFMSSARKVILVAKTPYRPDNPEHQALLERLHAQRIGLFCAMGCDCETWHDRMDDVCVMASVSDGDDWQMLTSWHEGESLEEVLDFARGCTINCADSESKVHQSEIEIIEVQ